MNSYDTYTDTQKSTAREAFWFLKHSSATSFHTSNDPKKKDAHFPIFLASFLQRFLLSRDGL